MSNARSDAVRQEFLRGSLEQLIDDHEIQLLVRGVRHRRQCTRLAAGTRI